MAAAIVRAPRAEAGRTKSTSITVVLILAVIEKRRFVGVRDLGFCDLNFAVKPLCT